MTDIGDFKQRLRKRLVQWAEGNFFFSTRQCLTTTVKKKKLFNNKTGTRALPAFFAIIPNTSFAKCGWRKKREKFRRQLFTPTVAKLLRAYARKMYMRKLRSTFTFTRDSSYILGLISRVA